MLYFTTISVLFIYRLFGKNIIARLLWVLAPGSAQVHSTQISIYIKLHEGLYGLQFVPVLNFLK